MRPLFDTNPLAAVIYWGTLGLAFLTEARQSGRQRDGANEQDAGSGRVIRVTMIVGILVAINVARNVPDARIHTSRLAIYLVGLGMIWAGMGLRYSAFHTLGRYFTFTVMTSGDQEIVTRGPYRLLRHPGYAGGLLVLAGIGLALGNWLSFAANTLIPLIGVVNRITVEERALRSSVGDSYEQFARGRKRLIPFVW